jgi:hypothetical protein
MFTIIEENRINLDELIENLLKTKKIENLGDILVKRKKMINYLKKIQKVKKDLFSSNKNKK